MNDVILQMYTFSILGVFTYTHTEVLWKGLDLYLSRKDGPIIAVHIDKEKHSAFGYKSCRRINLGVSLMSLEEFTDNFGLLSRDFANYSLLSGNCRHFSIDVLSILEPVHATSAIVLIKKMNYKLDLIKLPFQFIKVLKDLVGFTNMMGFALAPLILMNEWMVFVSNVFFNLARFIQSAQEQIRLLFKRCEKALELHLEVTEHSKMSNFNQFFDEPSFNNEDNIKYTVQWSSSTITVICVSVSLAVITFGKLILFVTNYNSY